MPFRDENQLDECQRALKYMEVKTAIGKNLRQHEEYVAIHYDELINFPDTDESDVENKSSDFDKISSFKYGFQSYCSFFSPG